MHFRHFEGIWKVSKEVFLQTSQAKRKNNEIEKIITDPLKLGMNCVTLKGIAPGWVGEEAHFEFHGLQTSVYQKFFSPNTNAVGS